MKKGKEENYIKKGGKGLKDASSPRAANLFVGEKKNLKSWGNDENAQYISLSYPILISALGI